MEHREISHRDTLLILVTSDRFFYYVESLTQAALAKGKEIRIHIWGDGVGFIKTDAFKRLSRLARVSICAVSLSSYAHAAVEAIPEIVKIVHPRDAADVFKQCTRHLVF